MIKNCSVSIVCANYNNGLFLDDFFKSILGSTYSPQEIIIVDDGSTDNSLEIIHYYENLFSNLKLIELKKNVGFANALNIAVENVTCEYILRIDPDDILSSVRIEMQYNYLIEHNEIDVLGSNVCYFHSIDSLCDRKSNFPVEHKDILNRYLDGSHGLVHGGVMIKSFLMKDNVYRQCNVPAEEYDIFSRLLFKKYIAHNLPDALTFVRVHDASVSDNMPFSTVKKTFDLRYEIWGVATNKLYVYKEFIARNLYRSALKKNNSFIFIYLSLVCILKPVSFIKKVLSYVK